MSKPIRIPSAIPRRTSLPWLALVGMLTLSAIAAEYVQSTKDRAEQSQYEYSVKTEVQKIRDAIGDRMRIYIGLLRGAAGLFAADQNVTRQDFARYVAQIDLPNNYPGVRGIGYCEMDRPTPGGEVLVVRFLEPSDNLNQQEIGKDMFSQASSSRSDGVGTAETD